MTNKIKTTFIWAVSLTLFTFFLPGYSDGGRERVYTTEDEVLRNAFPEASFKKGVIVIDESLRARLNDKFGEKIYGKPIGIYEASLSGEVQGYGFLMNEVGKTKDITFMVVIDRDGNVRTVEILVFRESQGYEVSNKRWLNQFRGKSLSDRLRVKRDIDNISGATLSARSVTKGVKKCLLIYDLIRSDGSLAGYIK